MPSFSELYSGAEERWQPEEGGEYTTIVVECRVGETQNGYPSINLWLEVVNGPDSGERFWDGTYLSANKRANSMAFAKLEAASAVLNETFFAGDPSDAEIEQALMGCKMKLQTTYEHNDRDPERPWLRCVYMPLSDASSSDLVDLEAGANTF